MAQPNRGEVWLVDFGLAGKTRPALVVNVAFGSKDRALITVIPHTTSLRGSSFEIAVSVPYLKAGAFMVQGVTTVPTVDAVSSWCFAFRCICNCAGWIASLARRGCFNLLNRMGSERCKGIRSEIEVVRFLRGVRGVSYPKSKPMANG